MNPFAHGDVEPKQFWMIGATAGAKNVEMMEPKLEISVLVPQP